VSTSSFDPDISPRWQIEIDPERTSEVEVRFIAEAADRTRVEPEQPRSAWRRLGGGSGGRRLRGRLADLPAQVHGRRRHMTG
jgi:hypothetical protein